MKRTELKRKASLRSSRKPLAKKSAKRAAKRKADGSDDPEYRAWILTQPSIVEFKAGYVQLVKTRLVAPVYDLHGIEGHHDGKPRRDRRMVPLYWWLHQFTRVSVHGGGGRRRFEQRFGISFDAEVARLNAKYEAEKGNS